MSETLEALQRFSVNIFRFLIFFQNRDTPSCVAWMDKPRYQLDNNKIFLQLVKMFMVLHRITGVDLQSFKVGTHFLEFIDQIQFTSPRHFLKMFAPIDRIKDIGKPFDRRTFISFIIRLLKLSGNHLSSNSFFSHESNPNIQIPRKIATPPGFKLRSTGADRSNAIYWTTVTGSGPD